MQRNKRGCGHRYNREYGQHENRRSGYRGGLGNDGRDDRGCEQHRNERGEGKCDARGYGHCDGSISSRHHSPDRTKSSSSMAVRVDTCGSKELEMVMDSDVRVSRRSIVQLVEWTNKLVNFQQASTISASYPLFGDYLMELFKVVEWLRQVANVTAPPPPLPLYHLPLLPASSAFQATTRAVESLIVTSAKPTVVSSTSAQVCNAAVVSVQKLDMKDQFTDLWRSIEWLQTEKPAFDDRMKSVLEDKLFMDAVAKLQLELTIPSRAPCMFSFMKAALAEKKLSLAEYFVIMVFNVKISTALVEHYGLSIADTVRLRNKAEIAMLNNLDKKENASRRDREQARVRALPTLKETVVQDIIMHGMVVHGSKPALAQNDLRHGMKRKFDPVNAHQDIELRWDDLPGGSASGNQGERNGKKKRYRRGHTHHKN